MQIECTVAESNLRTFPGKDENYVGGWLNVDVVLDGQKYASGGYITTDEGQSDLVEPVLYEDPRSSDIGGANRLPTEVARKAVREWMWGHWSEIWDAYRARRPKTFENTVEQAYDYHSDGTSYVRTITVMTDGADHTSDWDTMSDVDRNAHDKWVEDYHDAMVDVAEAEPGVRERVAQMIARGDGDQDGDTLRGFLEGAKKDAA